MDHAAALGLDPEGMESLRDRLETARFEGREYESLSSERRGVERGTVLFEECAVRGYPSTPRALVAAPAIRERFEGRVHVEEKLNGYNVRLARIDGDVLALTRSGHVCPVTTGHARRTYDLEPFFDEHPETMVCVEYVGPATPYTSHDYPDVDGMAARAFSVRDRTSGEPWSVERRRAVLDDYDAPQVPLLGTYDDPDGAAEEVLDHLRRLEAEGREGVVCKSADGSRVLKYTAGATNREDLAHAFALPFECARDFLFSRVMREAFQAHEFDDGSPALRERAHELGEAILLPFVETIDAVERDGTVGEDHVLRGRPAEVAALLSHFEDQGIELAVLRDETGDRERVVEAVKVAAATRDKVDYYLDGGTYDE
jgi:putative ATP-dependent DNA ligase